MLKAIGNVIKRTYDLLIKMISVKGLVFAIGSWAYIKSPSTYTFLGFILSGALLITFRELEKWNGLLKSYNDK
jgi:hypothetical protein